MSFFDLCHLYPLPFVAVRIKNLFNFFSSLSKRQTMDIKNPGPLVGKTTKQQLQKGGGGGKKRKPSESTIVETEYLQILTRLEKGRKTKQQQEQGRGSPYTPRPSSSTSSSAERGQSSSSDRGQSSSSDRGQSSSPDRGQSSSPDRGQQQKLGKISGLQSLVCQLRKLEKEYQQQKQKTKQGQKFKS